jgi:hypothetical protein
LKSWITFSETYQKIPNSVDRLSNSFLIPLHSNLIITYLIWAINSFRLKFRAWFIHVWNISMNNHYKTDINSGLGSSVQTGMIDTMIILTHFLKAPYYKTESLISTKNSSIIQSGQATRNFIHSWIQKISAPLSTRSTDIRTLIRKYSSHCKIL